VDKNVEALKLPSDSLTS